MAATVLIREKNTLSETPTDKTSGTVRFKNADNATVDLSDPLQVPTSGQEYSVEKWLRANISGGTFTQISNLRAYSDGSNEFGTGVKTWYDTIGAFDSTNGGTVPNEANDPPLGPDDATPMTDWFGTNSGSPADLDAINTGPFDSTGLPKDIGDYLVLVMEVEPTASQGVLSTETLTVSWDEI